MNIATARAANRNSAFRKARSLLRGRKSSSGVASETSSETSSHNGEEQEEEKRSTLRQPSYRSKSLS